MSTPAAPAPSEWVIVIRSTDREHALELFARISKARHCEGSMPPLNAALLTTALKRAPEFYLDRIPCQTDPKA